ncbi:MAG: rhombotarget lipoprotein [Holophagaceae bacterium]|uniref:Rhombotarget lipoprotein n=1 Tax=Candidatus Geothrix skivensis TaxID=2954439 RepID=A0A9D7SH55_9BACT|nr:rhombotarget lipoprotein [Candidatus Geothrix skivensis]
MRTSLSAPLAALLLLVGCATPETVQRRSSLATYLGAKASPPTEPATGPAKLQLPLRLGIAFVPADAGQRAGSLNATAPANLMDPAQEQDLHKQVADLFGQKPWALSFKIIPAIYLAKGGGFADLDQVSRSFGVDVVALVSVDQVQFSSPRWYAWTYWTLVGAYMVKGDKNDTTSLVDAAVYHVPSHTFLFRAGGIGTVKGSSSWSNREEAFRQQSRESLALAMANLSGSLDQGVAGFKQDLLKGVRKDVQLVDKDGNPLGSAAYDPARR